MGVFLNCFILCVWQFTSVRPAGVNLPFTSITYKPSPTNPRSLSLSFWTNDSMDSKTTTYLEDFKPMKTSQSSQDEEVSKKLSQLGLIPDNYLKQKDFNFSKQKQNDPNILYEDPFQKNVPNLRTNDKYYVPQDVQNKKNSVNYNIKVISPPAVFNNLPTYLPVTQNVADNKMISEINKYSKNVPPSCLLPYPVRTLTEEGKQETIAAWQNVRKTYSDNEDGTKYKIVEPLVQKNTINIAEHLIPNMVKAEDIIVPPKANAKCTHNLNINKTPLNMDSRSNNLYDYNYHQIPLKYLDTSYIQKHDTLPTMSDIININQEIKPSGGTLSKHATEIKPNLPEISKPQQICTSDYDSYNLQIGSSLDNIMSFLKSNFNLAVSDSSTTNSLRIPTLLSAPELLQPHITASVNLSKTPVFVSTYPEVESPTYLPKPNLEIPLKVTDNATKKSITKSPVPYISSVTINYVPCIESSNEIMIFV